MNASKKLFKLYTDGGARGNPGPAAIGIIIVDMNGKVLQEIKRAIGVATNNQAEYRALVAGMKIVARLWNGNLSCYSDSELVIKQMNGEYQVRNRALARLHDAVKLMERSFSSVQYLHVPREHPMISRADALVNEALDQA